MIRLWSGFYKPLSFRERSSSHVIIDVSRSPTPVVKAGDIVHVDRSGYFKIIGEPNLNSERLWFEAEIGRSVKTKEVRRRTRQKYQLRNLRNLRSTYENNPDDVEIIDSHIKLCMEDKRPEAALVGWVMCMEAVDKEFVDMFRGQKSQAVERREQAESFGWADDVKRHSDEIEELDYTIEGLTTFLERKHYGLCAHAWDCDE